VISTSSVKRWFKRWLEDTVHYFNTGEGTIHCEAGHKVFIDPWGGTRIDPSEFLRSEGGKKALEWASQLHKPQTNPQPTMENNQDKNLETICEYLKNNPDRLMELLREIPIPRKMESFPMVGFRIEYLKYDLKIYRRESKGSGFQWSQYFEDLMQIDPDCKWQWEPVGHQLAMELEGRYMIDCVKYVPDTYIASNNECDCTL
jgi:hypothetical protein